MTQVRLALAAPTSAGTVRRPSGSVEWRPTKRRNVAGDVVLPAPFTVGLADTPPVIDVAPTEPGWAWQVVERVQGGSPKARYLTVPDSPSVIDYADLVEVDPATLDPVALSNAWWTQVTDYVATHGGAVASVNDQTGTVVLGAADVGAQPAGDYATNTALTTGLAAKVNSSTYTAGLAAKQDTATLGAAVVADATVKAAFGRGFSVRSYGAAGDGTTNDTAAFQAAADAARDAGGGVVYAPAGTYLIGSSITWRSKVSLVGDGPGRTILKSAATITGAPIQVGASLASPLTDVLFRDFEIDGSAVPTSTSSKGIFITYMKRARFENVYIHHTTATGFGCDFLQDTVFSRCVAENCGRAATGAEATTAGCSGFGVGTGASQVENVVIANCVARNNARYGIFFEFQTTISTFLARGVIIADNYVDGNNWGIGSCGIERARIVGNTVVNSVSHGVVVAPSDATHGALSIGDQITGNTIVSNGGRGISVDASNDGGFTPPYRGFYKIADNTIKSNTGVGVKFSTSGSLIACSVDANTIAQGGSLGLDLSGGGGFVDSNIIDNLILDNTGVGVRWLAPMTRTRMANNKAADTRATGKTQTYGLELSATFTFTDCDIRNNDLRGNATGAINRAGTVAAGTVIRENLGDGPTTEFVSAPPAGLKLFRRDVGSADVAGLRIFYGPGASTLQGQGATTMASRSIERIGARLASRLGLGSAGTWIAPHNGGITSPTWPVTYSAGVARRFDFGIGQRTLQVHAADTVTWTFTSPGGPAGIAYRRGSATGTMNVSIDGGAATAVATNGTVTEFVVYQTAALSAGSHTITITCTGADIFIEGLNTNPGATVQMYEAGNYGSSTATWAANGYSAISAIDPHLAVLCLGSNDQTFGNPNYSVTKASFKTALTGMLASIRAQKAGLPVLIVGQPEQDLTGYAAGYTPWSDFIAAMAEVAAADASAYFFDAGAVLGKVAGNTLGIYADFAHMNDKGQGWWSDLIIAELTAGLIATTI